MLRSLVVAVAEMMGFVKRQAPNNAYVGAREIAPGAVSADSAPAFANEITIQYAAVVPAVAGYERRIEVVDRLLAARLASVSKLNSPKGRITVRAQKSDRNAPAIPLNRVGAKRQRAMPAGVLIAGRTTWRRTAEIIPFPVRDVAAVAGEDLLEFTALAA